MQAATKGNKANRNNNTSNNDSSLYSKIGNFYQYYFQNKIISMEYCESNGNKYLFLLTINSELYKINSMNSQDIISLTSKLKEISEEKYKSSILDKDDNDSLELTLNLVGNPTKLVASPANPSILFIIGTKGFNWLVQDCGNLIQSIYIPNNNNIINIQFHPSEKKYALFTILNNCENDVNNDSCEESNDLYVTKNLFESYKLIAKKIIQYSWGVVNNKFFLEKSKVNKNRILLISENEEDENNNIQKNFVYSDNFFDDSDILVENATKYYINSQYLYVEQLQNIDSGKNIKNSNEIKLYLSVSNTKKYKFKEVEINENSTLYQYSYNILFTLEHFVFLYINNKDNSNNYGELLVSDYNGNRFAFSLKNILRYSFSDDNFSYLTNYNYNNIHNSIREGIVNIVQIKSIESTYIASVISKDYFKMKKKKILYTNSLDFLNYIETYITYNKGGDWQKLKKPNSDSQDKKYNCTLLSSSISDDIDNKNENDYCNLHLFTHSLDIPNLMSNNDSSEIVLSNGNVGKYLSNNDYSNVNLFISNDGGTNWKEIKKGVHIYSIENYGTLIIIAKYNVPTKEVLYSIDQGFTFNSISISDSDEDDVLIQNITFINEIFQNSKIFWVVGKFANSNYDKNFEKYFLVNLDINKLNLRVCSMDDYQNIMHISQGNKLCINGIEYLFTKKKFKNQCISEGENEERSLINLCTCSIKDYQCDIGYKKVDNKCQLINSKNQSDNEKIIPLKCSGFFIVKSHYRKVPENQCVYGDEYEDKEYPCPRTPYEMRLLGVFSVAYVSLIIFFIWSSFSTTEDNNNNNDYKFNEQCKDDNKDNSLYDYNFEPLYS